MSPAIAIPTAKPIVYPDTDGTPMCENTKQFNAIVTIKENLEIQFKDDPLVFVAGDLFWYPEEGNNRKRTAPDVMVVFGVPKGDRSSYLQWVENNIAPQVVFEVLSPNNTVSEMSEKQGTYDRQGVEEYYIFDPETGVWDGWIRGAVSLQRIETMHGWVSPRLKIRFESIKDSALTLIGSNGHRFRTVMEIAADHEEASRLKNEIAKDLELECKAREQATRRADEAVQKATEATRSATEAIQRASEATRRAEEVERQNAQLLAALKAAGIELPKASGC